MHKHVFKEWETDLAWATGVGVMVTLIAAPPGSISKLNVALLVLLGGSALSVGAIGRGWMTYSRREMLKTVGVFIFIWGATIGLGRAKWPPDQRRHLSGQQKEGLANARDNFPKHCGMLVYVPIESIEAQNYGKEIQDALQMHGSKTNLIYAGAMEPPIGIVVGVRSSLEPCGFAGEMLSVQMTHDLHMPARLQERFSPYADETTVVIFVGTKPNYE